MGLKREAPNSGDAVDHPKRARARSTRSSAAPEPSASAPQAPTLTGGESQDGGLSDHSSNSSVTAASDNVEPAAVKPDENLNEQQQAGAAPIDQVQFAAVPAQPDSRFIVSPQKHTASEATSAPVSEDLFKPADVDTVICSLGLPDANVQVASEFSNALSTDTQVQAYAKLAGRSWTFYVQRLEVVIGRRAADANEHIDIDLGPSKVVSRRHALIAYNLTTRTWELTVLGRNGLKVDGTSQKRGTIQLRSGHILEIGGCQMMFVLPDAHPVVSRAMVPSAAAASVAVNNMDNMVLASPAVNAAPMSVAPVVAQPAVQSRPYPKGLAIVSRPQIRGMETVGAHFEQDLSLDECRDIKPPFSYATMISQAILSTEENAMSLADIYVWISTHYSFYRFSKPGWQNSIRHNLSLNKAFEKVARKENEPGKGSKWQITAKYREEFLKKAHAGKLIKGRSNMSPVATTVYVPPAMPPVPQPAMHNNIENAIPILIPGHPQAQAQNADYYNPRATLPQPPLPPAGQVLQNGETMGASVSPQRVTDIPTLPSSIVRKLPDMELEKPYLEFLDAEYNASSPLRYTVTQPEAYTPDRGSSSSKRTAGPTPKLNINMLAGSSPAFWKYMQFNSTPVKGSEKSPSRVREDLGELPGVDLRF